VQALFDGGRVIDLILALMVVEAVALTMLYRATGRGIAPVRLWPNLLAGAFLMLALRASLTGAGVAAIGSWLFLGLIGHLVDLALRWSYATARV
jgi:hypothetical protein